MFCCLLLVVLLVVLFVLVFFGQSFWVFDWVWFVVQEWCYVDVWKECLIWLLDYCVWIEVQFIEGLNDDVFVLIFDFDWCILFIVINQLVQIIELFLQGKVLWIILLIGFGDVEVIEYISCGVYVIIDECQ